MHIILIHGIISYIIDWFIVIGFDFYRKSNIVEKTIKNGIIIW